MQTDNRDCLRTIRLSMKQKAIFIYWIIKPFRGRKRSIFIIRAGSLSLHDPLYRHNSHICNWQDYLPNGCRIYNRNVEPGIIEGPKSGVWPPTSKWKFIDKIFPTERICSMFQAMNRPLTLSKGRPDKTHEGTPQWDFQNEQQKRRILRC